MCKSIVLLEDWDELRIVAYWSVMLRHPYPLDGDTVPDRLGSEGFELSPKLLFGLSVWCLLASSRAIRLVGMPEKPHHVARVP